jgi:hypothetical protein
MRRLAAAKVGANNRQDRDVARCLSSDTHAVQDAFAVEHPVDAYPIMAGKISYRPETLALRTLFVTAVCAQRYPADFCRLLLGYIENDARNPQTMPLVAPSLTRSHNATPSAHRVIAQCVSILYTPVLVAM